MPSVPVISSVRKVDASVVPISATPHQTVYTARRENQVQDLCMSPSEQMEQIAIVGDITNFLLKKYLLLERFIALNDKSDYMPHSLLLCAN